MGLSRYPKTDRYTYQPTGNAADDTNAFVGFINALPSTGGHLQLGPGTLVLDGAVAPYAQTLKPLFISGQRNMSTKLRLNNGFSVNWGSFSHPFGGAGESTWDGLTYASRSNAIANPSTALVEGDWIVIWSTDSVPDVTPHLTTYSPAQLVKIGHVTGTTGYISDPVLSDYSTTPKFAKVTLINGCGMENLLLESDGTNTSFYTAFTFNYCNSPRVSNCLITQQGCGAIVSGYSHDVLIQGVSGLNQPGTDSVYGVVPGLVNGFTFEDSEWYECRHVFTTTAPTDPGDATRRFGIPHNIRVRNVTAHCSSNAVGTMVVFDTHAEGDGVSFESCRVYGGRNTITLHAFGTRSRNTRILDCYVDGGGTNAAIGCNVNGPDTEIRNSTFRRCWEGVRLNSTSSPRLHVRQSRFVDGDGPAVRIERDSGHQVVDNFMFSHENASSNFRSLQVENSPGALTWPEHVYFAGNHVRGFGTGRIGVLGETGDPQSSTLGPSIQSAYASENYGDP